MKNWARARRARDAPGGAQDAQSRILRKGPLDGRDRRARGVASGRTAWLAQGWVAETRQALCTGTICPMEAAGPRPDLEIL